MTAFPPSLFAGRHFAVCGLGRNGAAVVQALLDMGATVRAWDDRTPELPLHERLTLAPLNDLAGVEALILSPGIPHTLPSPHPAAALARMQGVAIVSDAEILWRAVRKTGSRARFVSVTGTNGKSTTTALIAHILRQAGLPVAEGGNLGTAALALPLLGDDGVYVVEMSSYMLERLDRYQADAACLLNITPDHLDRHGDMAGYAAAKAHVFDAMGPSDLAAIGTDDAWCRTIAEAVRARGVPVVPLDHAHTPAFEGPALPGRHNAQNVAAAWAIVRHLGVHETMARHAIKTFGGLEHRLQTIAHHEGVSFVNDSKATNAEAASKALAAYPRVMWIAGGVAKSGGITTLAPLFDHIAKAFLIGKDAPQLAATLQEHAIAFEMCETLDAAVPAAFRAAREEGVPVVLLSPACASFDQFASFEARGSYFLHICNNIVHSGCSLTTRMQGD